MALVAALTFGCVVLPFQWVRGVAVVIEANQFPALFPMAGLTVVAEGAFVLVVLPVAGLTSRWRFLFGYGDFMAFLAGDEVMRAKQEILRVAVMIERRR